MWRFAPIPLALFCGACASSPSSLEAGAFGRAATETLTLLTDERVANLDLIRESRIEGRTCDYLSTGAITLKPPFEVKGEKLIENQVVLLSAISDYAKALSEAADPRSDLDLEAAAGKLAGATGPLLSAIPSSAGSPLSSPVVNPAIALVSAVAIDLVELRTRERLRSVIQATEPYLDRAAQQLILDSPDVEKILRRSYSAWAKSKACNLAVLRKDGRVDAYLYTTYKDADNAAREFERRLAIFNTAKLAEIMVALQNAHHAMLDENVDFQKAYQELRAILSQLQAIRAAVTSTKSVTASGSNGKQG